MKNLHLLSELHLFHLFCYMRNLPFLIAFSFALIYQRKSFALTIVIHPFQNIFIRNNLLLASHPGARNIVDGDYLLLASHPEARDIFICVLLQ